jgi:hypothetical protein
MSDRMKRELKLLAEVYLCMSVLWQVPMKSSALILLNNESLFDHSFFNLYNFLSII